MATKKKRTVREDRRYWLSYDLGLRGDYDSLYEWLDSRAAKECGDSIATFTSDRSPEEIRSSLERLMGSNLKTRIYLISGGNGRFLMGKRKPAPWAGYFQDAVDSVMDA